MVFQDWKNYMISEWNWYYNIFRHLVRGEKTAGASATRVTSAMSARSATTTKSATSTPSAGSILSARSATSATGNSTVVSGGQNLHLQTSKFKWFKLNPRRVKSLNEGKGLWKWGLGPLTLFSVVTAKTFWNEG